MTDFCSLHVRSNDCAELPLKFLKNRKKINLVFTDNESPERRASFERLRQSGAFQRKNPPRYHWWFSSDGFVDGFDVHEHLTWVLDKVSPNFLLSQLKSAGFECWLQFYWEGNGTGGGPNITPEIAALLVRHEVNLQFGFYLEPDEV